MIQIVRMRSEDISSAIRLSNQEKWETPRSDLERILFLNPRGSFIAFENRSKVGIITTVAFGRDLAWIGNVIVDKKHRGKHVGQLMVNYAVAYLKAIRVKKIGLYCFANNVGFYEKLGFVKDAGFVRLRRNRKARHLRGQGHQQEENRPPKLSQLIAADKKCFGVDRSKLLLALMAKGYGNYFGFIHNKSAAYLVVKKYSDMYDFGPGVAVNASRVELSQLLNLALRHTWKKSIELSCLAQNKDILLLLRRQGFHVIDRGYRMFFNSRAKLGSDRANFLLGFQDKG